MLQFKHAIVITGSIGSGKSTVCEILAGRGFEIINADSIAHEQLNLCASEVAAEFGDEVLIGGGQKMHTHYKRNSVSLVGTLMPTETTALQLSADLGEGEAAYADRMRDGVQFDRKSFGLKF